MWFRIPEQPASKLRTNRVSRIGSEPLETRMLLASSINFGGQPPQVATFPYGVMESGTNHVGNGSTPTTAQGGGGFSVADAGDVNHDGFEDYLIGGPGVTPAVTTPTPTPALNLPSASNSNNIGEAYLLFGSQQQWLAITSSDQRVGDLEQLGNPTQTNPINGNPTFAYQGIRFYGTAPQQGGTGLGYSVSPVIDNGSTVGILIGAPFSAKAYYVTGSGLSPGSGVLSVDLNATTQPSGITVVTILNSASTGAGSLLGWSVSSVGNFLGTGTDIAIGAPLGSITGNPANSGAVYVIPLTDMPSTTGTVDVSQIGLTQSSQPVGNLPGAVVIAGSNAGDLFGFAVAGAGNVTGSGVDMLVGAPQYYSASMGNGGSGLAYLIHGNQGGQLLANLTINPSTVQAYVPALAIGSSNDSIPTGETVVLGARFKGANSLDETGYSVGTAGDLNDDGLQDIQFGSPGVTRTASTPISLGTGVDTVIFAGGNFPITGQFTMPSSYLPTSFGSVFPMPVDPTTQATVLGANFLGQSVGDLTGFSSGIIGQQISSDITNELAIGSPGANGFEGQFYIIPGTPAANYFYLLGNFSLANALTPTTGPINGSLVQTSQGTSFQPGVPSNFGISVSGGVNLQSGDFIVGASSYSPTATTTNQDGAAMIGQSLLQPLGIQLARGAAVGNTSQTSAQILSVNSGASVTVRVFSVTNTGTPGLSFDASTDIDTTQPIALNGYLIPANDYTLVNSGDSNDDADVTFVINALTTLAFGTSTPSTGSALLLGGVVTDKALTGQSTPNFWLGGNSISPTPTPTPTPGSGSVLGVLPPGFIFPTSFQTQFGPETFVPSIPTLSQYDYTPIPVAVAYQQFRPSRGFAARIYNIEHPSHPIERAGARSNHLFTPSGTNTLGGRVFTRDKFHPGKVVKFTHKVRVIPSYNQRERLIP